MPSALISRFKYNPETRCLSVWFVRTRRRYDYEDVPPETHEEFRRAFSKGSFFNRHIRDHFRFSVAEEAAEPQLSLPVNPAARPSAAPSRRSAERRMK
ncbi:KTSC domain-containing protein [Pseudaminobacter sp. 19-2017]|uniref:KTSC domain-containing protein n=2 Tax=Pseudaminobacter soli (ex Zhang et al. 2022) TaxID=2831468 RepID=A0A942I409_9HYPH|nr:KTSC domain-containing protein [Pseudaminobacter soli]